MREYGTPVDSLKIGDWVAVVRYKQARSKHTPWGSWDVEPSYDGRPGQVVAISLPFVALTDGARVGTIDVRDIDLQRVTEQYAKAVLSSGAVPVKVRRRRRGKPDPSLCPRCGDRLQQFMSKRTEFKFRVRCPSCGWDGGPVLAE